MILGGDQTWHMIHPIETIILKNDYYYSYWKTSFQCNSLKFWAVLQKGTITKFSFYVQCAYNNNKQFNKLPHLTISFKATWRLHHKVCIFLMKNCIHGWCVYETKRPSLNIVISVVRAHAVHSSGSSSIGLIWGNTLRMPCGRTVCGKLEERIMVNINGAVRTLQNLITFIYKSCSCHKKHLHTLRAKWKQ